MPTTGRIVSFDDNHTVVLEVTLDDGTVLPIKSCGCVIGTMPDEIRDSILRKIRAREIHSRRGQEMHRARLAAKWPMLVFG